MVDLPGSLGELKEASAAASRPAASPSPESPRLPGARHGLKNDYTGWFAADPEMAGDCFGYDTRSRPSSR